MGRELKRVPLDFDWSTKQVWKGYLNPYHSQKCQSCDQTGLNLATKAIHDSWYSFDETQWLDASETRRFNNKAWGNHITEIEVAALVKAGRLHDLTHDWVGGSKGWVEKVPAYIPTAEEVNQWNRTGFGHDSTNQSICVKARAENLDVYGKCTHCNGEGEIWQSEEIKSLNEEWRQFDPPIGDGFQLWSTTTEGHPITPVFGTLDALCEYCDMEKVYVFGHQKMNKAEWILFLS